MRTITTIILSFGVWTIPAWGQIIIQPRPVLPPPRPAGIILPPQPATAPGLMQPPRRVIFNPWYYGGYLPYYEPTPAPTVINNITIRVPQISPPPAPKPIEKKARLQLVIPRRSQVWLNGNAVDVNAVPLILESPDLRDGQTYTFNIKVVWMEGDQREERIRSVSVGLGEQKSVSYFASR